MKAALVALLACVSLAGCALCQRHETACNVAIVTGTALALGAVVVLHDNRQKTGCTCGCPGTPVCR